VGNSQTLENFARAARTIQQRPEPPFLIAGTLLVTGYIDVQEVSVGFCGVKKVSVVTGKPLHISLVPTIAKNFEYVLSISLSEKLGCFLEIPG